jgi:hypothetical protein
MEKNINNTKFIIEQLKKRRGMYVFDNSYNSLISFLVGYLLAIRDLEVRDISLSFQKWLQDKEGKYFSVHWSRYILVELSKNDENTAKKKMLELFELYLFEEENI